jgi:hypothetical protein
MRDKSCGYKVVFSVSGLSMKQQQEIYDLLRKNLSFDMKDCLSIMVEDPVGGKHNIWDDNGIKPNGEICKKCSFIDCQFCIRYKEDKDGKQSNTK